MSTSFSAKAQTVWEAVGGGVTHDNVQPIIRSMAIAPNGDVYVGGQFMSAGADTNAVAIARWDGSAWHNLGANFGPTDFVSALAFAPNGDLWVGGDFFDAGGVQAADYLARWDGSAWDAPNLIAGRDLNGAVDAIAVNDSGHVYFGGFFTQAGGIASTNRIARWDGTTYHPLGTGITDGGVTAVAIAVNGDVYTGGFYNTINGNFDAARVSRWDGTSWSPLGPGITSGDVNALVADPNGGVYVGGGLPDAGGVSGANNVARFDGTSWHALGNGIGVPGSQNVFSLALSPAGDLFVGGLFVGADNNPDINGIAKWDGTSWSALDVGIAQSAAFPAFGLVRALAYDAGALYAGGEFEHNADSSVVLNGIGRFSDSIIAVEEEVPREILLTADVSPQPMSGHGRLNLSLGSSVFVSVTLFDVLGREIANVYERTLNPGEHAIEINIDNRPSGVYFLRVEAGREASVVEVVVAR